MTTRPHTLSTGRRKVSTTEQRDRARATRNNMIDERNMLLRLLCAQFPAHLAEVANLTSRRDGTQLLPYVVCLHIRGGHKLAWKISEEDRAQWFADLPERADDWEYHTHDTKLELLADLITLTPPLKW